VRRHHKTAHPDGTAVPAGAQKSPPVSLHVTQTTGSVTRFPVRQGIVVCGAAGFTRLLADRRGELDHALRLVGCGQVRDRMPDLIAD
jgi:hypothetical protein